MRIKLRRRWVGFGIGLFLGLGLPDGHPETVSLVPTADNTLFETSPDNNLGGDAQLASGTTAKGLKSRALIKFDLAGRIPSNAVITAVTLRLQVIKEPAFGAKPSDFELRRVLQSWGEGNKKGSTGGLASPGESTWKARSAPSGLWNEPGGGADFAATSSATLAVNEPGTYTFASTIGLVTDVQDWLRHAEANFGWVLQSRAEELAQTARRWASREAASNPPMLIIDYQPKVAELRMTSMVVHGTNATVTWTGNPGRYQLQEKANLSENAWKNVGTVLQANSTDVSMGEEHRFFRVLLIDGQ